MAADEDDSDEDDSDEDDSDADTEVNTESTPEDVQS
jgi:hypothetical protein